MPEQTELENIAGTILPQLMDDGIGATSESKRSNYLSKRICGFSVREACQLCGIHEKSVRRWREEPEFSRLDTQAMVELRKTLSTNLIDFQFTRNLHLALEKDFNIMYKDATTPQSMTGDDKAYLSKIRQYYTPQALATIKQLLGGTTDKEFDFTRFVMTIRREESVEIREERTGM